jgi:hypothetical protein
MATLQNIRDFTRLSLQTDNVDLPDSLIDVYANEALQRILGLRDDWPHLYAEGTMAMVTNVGTYTLASASFTPQTFTNIQSIWDDAVFGRSMIQMDYQEASGRWIGPSASVTADPFYFSLYGGKVYLWPKPNASRTLRIGGYRDPNVMTLSTDVPDIPVQFHAGIEYGTCAMAYAQQEDAELSDVWRKMANESIRVAIASLFMNRRHRPIILFGRDQPWGMSYAEWIRRNV